MAIELDFGVEAIRSYKRLSYTAWYALAEFVDNSTQAYFNNKEELDRAYLAEGRGLEVSIVYERDGQFIRISDNSMGMSYEELRYALRVGAPPANLEGRSKYGMGLKTAACWLGNRWTVRTKRLGSNTEYGIEVDVERVADGDRVLPETEVTGLDPNDHYTVVEIFELNRKLQGRTIGKIKNFLRSMYRQDLRHGLLTLRWQDEPLRWEEFQFVEARDGAVYRRPFEFDVDGRNVNGWVGVLERGSRSNAGFSILQADRVVKGWPESWRPEKIYGEGGRNDLVNQRLTGEIHLDGFQVTHTKDDILWLGDEEQEVEDKLKEATADYRDFAQTRRATQDDERGPSDIEIQAAVEELESELGSAELVDMIQVELIPPPEVVSEAKRPLVESVSHRQPSFAAMVATLPVSGYLIADASDNDPYVVVDAARADRISVVVNMNHPYVKELSGAEGILNYLRHCTYDAIAEWQARHKAGSMDPDTIKMLKDRLLRLPSFIEMHQPTGDASEPAEPANASGEHDGSVPAGEGHA